MPYARMIELYAAHLEILVSESENWMHEYGTYPMVTVNGEALAKLFEHLGLELQPRREEQFSQKEKKPVGVQVELEGQELEIFHQHMHNPYEEFNAKIVSLVVDEIPGGVKLRITTEDVDAATDQDRLTVDELSYRGDYLVHWDTERNQLSPTPVLE